MISAYSDARSGIRPEVRVRLAVLLREAEVELVLLGGDGVVAEENDLGVVWLVRLGQLERRLLELRGR